MSNWFLLSSVFLYAGAAIQYAQTRQWHMAFVMVVYALANLALFDMTRRQL